LLLSGLTAIPTGAVKQYGGLNNAAVALGYASADALQQAIQEFCAA